MSNTTKILLAFSDPGGAQECAAIVRDLNSQALSFSAVTDSQGWIPPTLVSVTKRIEANELLNFVRNLNPDKVLVGTSVESEIELRLLQIARDLQIPNAAFIDHWTNYTKRFSRSGVTTLPDVIFVNDENARQQAILQGLPDSLLKIFPNPHFTVTQNFKNQPAQSVLKKKFGLKPDQPVLLFLSDALSESAGSEENARIQFGYSEKDVLKDLLQSLEKIDSDFHWQILVKTHPRENPKKEFLKNIFTERTIVVAPADCSLTDTFYLADRWIGMFTAALIELNNYGCIPMRYEPGAIKDFLPTSIQVFDRITEKARLESALSQYLHTDDKNVKFTPSNIKPDYQALLEFLKSNFSLNQG